MLMSSCVFLDVILKLITRYNTHEISFYYPQYFCNNPNYLQ